MTETEKKPTQLIQREVDIESGRGLVVRNTADLFRVAKLIALSGLVPKAYQNNGKPKEADIITAIVHGAEIGLSPMQALNSLAVINNRADLYAEGRPAVIFGSRKLKKYRDGYSGTYPEKDFHAWVEIERSDTDAVVRREFSIGDAIEAGLWGKGNWKLYPKDQLMWKAMSRALRVGFGDLLKGVGFVEDDRDIELHGSAVSLTVESEEPPSFAELAGESEPTDDMPDEDVIDVESEPVLPPFLEDFALQIEAAETETRLEELVLTMQNECNAEEQAQLMPYVEERRKALKKPAGLF